MNDFLSFFLFHTKNSGMEKIALSLSSELLKNKKNRREVFYKLFMLFKMKSMWKIQIFILNKKVFYLVVIFMYFVVVVIHLNIILNLRNLGVKGLCFTLFKG